MAVLCVSVVYYLLLIINPLPDDEDMIAHFQKHRSDFEEVVKRYREHKRPVNNDSSLWYKEGDTLDLYQRAGISSIDYSAYSPWFPNPYSLNNAKVIHERVFNGDYAIFHKYGALKIKLSPKQNYYSIRFPFSRVWKDLYFIPEIPLIENGYMLWPFNLKGEYSARGRVFSSLNYFPIKWKYVECIYRPIEPKWHIRMCNGH